MSEKASYFNERKAVSLSPPEAEKGLADRSHPPQNDRNRPRKVTP